MSRIALGASIAALAACIMSAPAYASPENEAGSKLILACDAGPCGPLITDYMSQDFWDFSLRHNKTVCNTINQSPSGVRGVSDAINYVESQGFSYLESVVMLIQAASIDCPQNKRDLVSWANTPWDMRSMS